MTIMKVQFDEISKAINRFNDIYAHFNVELAPKTEKTRIGFEVKYWYINIESRRKMDYEMAMYIADIIEGASFLVEALGALNLAVDERLEFDDDSEKSGARVARWANLFIDIARRHNNLDIAVAKDWVVSTCLRMM